MLGTSWEVAREARDGAARLFNEILPDGSVQVPELSDFVQAGIDFPRLQARFEAMENAGFKPEVTDIIGFTKRVIEIRQLNLRRCFSS